jgi:AcrR family transcriptional regulator
MNAPAARTGKGEATSRSILLAARRVFAERGFERATVRAIAREAGVDPALVLHYHGSKQRLFVTAIELPFEPETVLPALLAPGPDGVGERLVRFLLATFEGEAGAVMLGILRSAASDATAAEALRQIVGERIIGTVSRELAADDAELRATLVGSQVIGLAFARYVVRIEPLASATHDAVVAAVAPTLDRYLTADIRGREAP